MGETDTSKAIWTFDGFDPSFYDKVLSRSMEPLSTIAVIEQLLSNVPLDPGSKIVDAACYDASRSLPVSDRVGCRLVGVDISRHGADARRLAASDFTNAERLTFVQGRIEALGFPPKRGGCVLAVEASRHRHSGIKWCRSQACMSL